MRISLILLGIVLTGNLAADCCDCNYLGCQETNDTTYATIGGGAVFPMKNSTVRGDSTKLLFPSSLGVSLFQLPNMVWKSTYQSGYEAFAAVGCSPASHVRVEAEFLYQNLRRKITGSYDWTETNPATRQIAFEALGVNPVQKASSRTNIYSVLANFYYDFQNDCNPLTFSVGGGAGVAWLQSKGTTHDGVLNTAPVNPPTPTLEKSPRLYGTAFAWQLQLALNYDFLHRFSIGVGYRLFGTTRFQGSTSSVTSNPFTPDSLKFTYPQRDIRGLLNSSANVTVSCKF